jgi:hypothetical protein
MILSEGTNWLSGAGRRLPVCGSEEGSAPVREPVRSGTTRRSILGLAGKTRRYVIPHLDAVVNHGQ